MDGNTIFDKPKEESQTQVTTFEPPPSSSNILAKVFKILIGVAIVLVAAFLLFGFILPKIFESLKKEDVTITYWGIGKEESAIKPIITEFEIENPHVKINYSNQDIRQYRQRVAARISNGTGPDIFSFHNTWTSQLKNILLPLPSNVITKEEFSRNFYPVIRNDLVRNGAIYGVTLGIDTLSLYINTDLFNAAGLKSPSNWIDFQNSARSLTVKNTDNKIITAGAAMGTSNNIDHFPDIVSMLLIQNGVDLSNLSSNISSVADALNFYVSFSLPSPVNVWDETLDSSLRSFAEGKLAMYFGYARDFHKIESINPSLPFEIHPVPQLPLQNTTIASFWAEGVSVKTTHQKEALLFLKFLMKKENLEKLFASESQIKGIGEPYSRIDLADSLRENSNVYPFLANANYAVSSFFADETFDEGLNTKANAVLANSIDSILRGSSSLSAAESLSQSISQTLQEQQ